jgi:hypothetical protein
LTEEQLTFEERIALALQPYTETLGVLLEWRDARAHAREFTILACARLDALANIARVRGGSAEAFRKLLTTHGGKPELSRVSVPDLVRSLETYALICPALIPAAGRVATTGSDDQAFVDFVDASGLAITDEAIGAYLEDAVKALANAFRIRPRQPKRKQSVLRESAITTVLHDANLPAEDPTSALQALGGLIEQARLSSLLYREVRSAAIHEHDWSVEPAPFFREPSFYLRTVAREPSLEMPDVFVLQFSAQWLLDVYINCVDGVRSEWIARQRVPLSLFLEWWDVFEESEYLDMDSVAEIRAIGLSRRR